MKSPNNQIANSPNPRAVGYIRGSTEKQENTIEAQQNAITRYCNALGIDLVDSFTDSGVSGSSTFLDRPAVQSMLETMREQGVELIIFTKLDRAFRSVRDCVLTLDQWAQEEVAFHIIEQKIDTSNAMGRAFLQIMAVLAELENGQRSERQQAAFTVMRDQHQRCGTVPYGWDPVTAMGRISKTGRQADDLVPNHAEQRVLHQLLAWHEEGETDCEIARRLNHRRIPTKRGGRKWWAATVKSVREHAQPWDGESAAAVA